MSLSRIDFQVILTIFFWSENQCCSFSSMHPPSPINLGEVWTKQIYEAIRGSPQWNNTLFIITFDEHGVCNKLSRIPIFAIPTHQSSSGFFRPCPSTRWCPEPRWLDLYWNRCWWQELYLRLYPSWGPVRLHLNIWGHWERLLTYQPHISQCPNHPDLSLGWEGRNRARGS